LIDLGCDYGQGFLFSPPLPMADLSPFPGSGPLSPRARPPAADSADVGQGLVKPVMPI
jgi:hypothetical protein